MFTGIIEQTARIKSVRAQKKGLRVVIEKPRGWKLIVGQSICVNGICSTVVTHSARVFDVHYMPETLLKTTARALAAGSVVNLERSLVYGARIEGHFVLGHVDGEAVVTGVTKQGSSRLISIQLPSAFRRYVALHGSITVNGVALTVARLTGRLCTVALIPHTLMYTNLGTLEKGDAVNLEVDYLARYGIAAIKRGGTVGRNAKKGIQKSARRR
jgi:riboflavin synthase